MFVKKKSLDERCLWHYHCSLWIYNTPKSKLEKFSAMPRFSINSESVINQYWMLVFAFGVSLTPIRFNANFKWLIRGLNRGKWAKVDPWRIFMFKSVKECPRALECVFWGPKSQNFYVCRPTCLVHNLWRPCKGLRMIYNLEEVVYKVVCHTRPYVRPCTRLCMRLKIIFFLHRARYMVL